MPEGGNEARGHAKREGGDWISAPKLSKHRLHSFRRNSWEKPQQRCVRSNSASCVAPLKMCPAGKSKIVRPHVATLLQHSCCERICMCPCPMCWIGKRPGGQPRAIEVMDRGPRITTIFGANLP